MWIWIHITYVVLLSCKFSHSNSSLIVLRLFAICLFFCNTIFWWGCFCSSGNFIISSTHYIPMQKTCPDVLKYISTVAVINEGHLLRVCVWILRNTLACLCGHTTIHFKMSCVKWQCRLFVCCQNMASTSWMVVERMVNLLPQSPTNYARVWLDVF